MVVFFCTKISFEQSVGLKKQSCKRQWEGIAFLDQLTKAFPTATFSQGVQTALPTDVATTCDL